MFYQKMKMARKHSGILSPLFFGLLLSCGYSPFLNHKNEGEQIPKTTVQETESCALLFSENTLCAFWKWEEGPKQGENRLRLFFSNHESHQPTSLSQNLNVEIWMPGMGHGSLPTHVTSVRSGEYLIENIFFSMPGEWEIRIQLLNYDGSIAEQNSFKLVI